jgi:hypothetical protein
MLGNINLQPTGGFYNVKSNADYGVYKTRGKKIHKKRDGTTTPAEFSETDITIKTLE